MNNFTAPPPPAPPPPNPPPPSPQPVTSIHRRFTRPLAWGVGSVLVLAALYVALSHTDFSTLRSASPTDLLSVVGLVVMNLGFTSLLFWWATLSFNPTPRVTLGRMTALICVSALLNYLPMRAGLWGRAIYLKTHHQLSFMQSGAIVLGVLFVSGGVLGAIVLLPLLVPRELWVSVGTVSLFGLSVINVWLLPRLLRHSVCGAAWWTVLKLLDAWVGGARLWIVLGMMGHAVGYADALVLSAAGMLISMVGITPNGLGLREWLIAALAPLFVALDPSVALAAALIDRAIEVPVVAIAGLLSLRILR